MCPVISDGRSAAARSSSTGLVGLYQRNFHSASAVTRTPVSASPAAVCSAVLFHAAPDESDRVTHESSSVAVPVFR